MGPPTNTGLLQCFSHTAVKKTYLPIFDTQYFPPGYSNFPNRYSVSTKLRHHCDNCRASKMIFSIQMTTIEPLAAHRVARPFANVPMMSRRPVK